MSEFLAAYGFFILVVLLMLVCHLGHWRHGGRGRRRGNERDGNGPRR